MTKAEFDALNPQRGDIVRVSPLSHFSKVPPTFDVSFVEVKHYSDGPAIVGWYNCCGERVMGNFPLHEHRLVGASISPCMTTDR